jgi:hypothetical protein
VRIKIDKVQPLHDLQATGRRVEEAVSDATKATSGGCMKTPQSLSAGEETFALHCKAHGISPEREFRFCEGRKWAFDFAFPESMVAIEIEGGTAFGKSRHSRGKGFVNDCAKYNAATRLGWKVYRYTTEMVLMGTAINDLLEMEKA